MLIEYAPRVAETTRGSKLKGLTHMDSIPQKRCSQCKQEFPKTELYFGKHAMGKDGLRAACKNCTNASNKKYKTTDAGKIAEARYEHGESGRKTRKRITDKYTANNPQKRAAKSAVLTAVRHNILPHISKCKCLHCGKQAQHYHHWSYLPEHWLDVIPLCITCHKKVHAE